MTRERGLLVVMGLVAVLAVGLAGCQQPGEQPKKPAAQPAVAPTKTSRPTQPPTTHSVLRTSRPGAAATATPVPTKPSATPAPTTEPTPATQPGPASPSYPGKLVVRGADGLLYVAQADGSDTYALTDGIDPSWSPGGDQIAFVRWRESWGLFVINVADPPRSEGADEYGERQLIAEKDLRQPAWSPGGDVIAVVRGRLEAATSSRGGKRGKPGPPSGGGGSEVWVGVLKGVNPDTGGYYDGDYPADKYVQSPSWSPDGVHLVYEGKQGISITAMGENPRSLTPELSESVYATPVWSPRGDRIAYVRQMHNHWEIWSMNPDGTDRQRLTPSGTKVGERAYNSVAPAWSPNGTYIAFLTDRDGEWRVWVMAVPDGTDADGSGQRQLLDLPVKYEFNGDRILGWAW